MYWTQGTKDSSGLYKILLIGSALVTSHAIMPRFSAIQPTCSGPLNRASYGVDPVFKMGSTLYNPDLFNPQDEFMLGFYNCSQVPSPTYNLFEAVTNLTVNPRPYCSELYNPR
jgi:hypothetical protein